MELKYGFSYYPEHCFKEGEIEKDIELIKASGANVVRMGEFAWDQMEKEEGVFDFSVFEDVINRLGKEGIHTVMCTPTSCPPAWMIKKHPEILYVDNRGETRPFGARHSYCYNNEVYRQYSKRIAKKMGEVFGKNPYVLGFQIGNELAQEGTGRCHCDVCKKKFSAFLEDKYENIENFNKACGTYFWGQSISDFDMVEPPIKVNDRDYMDYFGGYFDNPGIRLNYEQFASKSLVEYANIQCDALREACDLPITSNSTGFGTNLIDYYDLYAPMDVYGMDLYPDLFNGDKRLCEYSYAFARNSKKSDFWILEFAIGGGHGLWAAEGRLQPYPKAIPLQVMHAYANGANMLVHFQYKNFRFGAEQLNYALLDADRVPRRRYKEFQKTVGYLNEHEKILLNTKNKKADIALVFDYDALWALKIKPINHDFNYIDYTMNLYSYFRECGYNIDIISKKEISSDYKMIVLPTLFVCDEETTVKLADYTKNGGTLVSTFLTAVKDMHNTAYDCKIPANLTEVFGACVSEVEPVFDNSRATINLELSKSVKGKNMHWLDELTPDTAKVIGEFGETFRKGNAVITENDYGVGKAYYIGTMLCEDAFKELISYMAEKAGIMKTPINAPSNVSVVERCSEGKTYYYIFNFNKTEIKIKLPFECKNSITGERIDKVLKMDEFDFICIDSI